MHLRDGNGELLDLEGREFSTLEALRNAVLFAVRDLMAGDVVNGRLDMRFRIDAHDEAGAIAYTLPFNQALNIIHEGEVTASLLAA
jgi:hypothetical protein